MKRWWWGLPCAHLHFLQGVSPINVSFFKVPIPRCLGQPDVIHAQFITAPENWAAERDPIAITEDPLLIHPLPKAAFRGSPMATITGVDWASCSIIGGWQPPRGRRPKKICPRNLLRTHRQAVKFFVHLCNTVKSALMMEWPLNYDSFFIG